MPSVIVLLSENVKTLMDRFCAAAHQADIDLSLKDDLLTSIDIREVLIAKVPDSVRRSLNGQKLKILSAAVN